MIYISHRGNINGKNESRENEPLYILDAINKGYDVEVDVWCKNNLLYLGHDEPIYGVDISWFTRRNLWIHCKNIEAVDYLSRYKMYNWFWHESDTLTLTSYGYIWANPGKQPINKSIAVLPEIYNDDVSKCIGICSDYIERYRNEGFQTRNNQIPQ